LDNFIAISYVMTFLINEGNDTDFMLLNQDQMKHVVNLVWCNTGTADECQVQPSHIGIKFK